MRLIVPDIHDRIDILDRVLKKYDFIKKVTSVGDWFDSLKDTSRTAAGETARRLRDFIADPNHDCLYGNHDIHYSHPEISAIAASGWGQWKQDAIDAVMGRNEWDKFKCHQLLELYGHKWLITHAGLHPCFSHPIRGIDDRWIHEITTSALEAIKARSMHYLFEPGVRRGGRQEFGGVTWLDFKDFIPIPEYNQICGHSYDHFGQVRFKPGPEATANWCIDTGFKHVAIIDDGGNCVIEAV